MYQNIISLIVASGVTFAGLNVPFGENPLLAILGFLGGLAVIFANVAKGKRDLAEKEFFEAQTDKLND